MNQVSQSWSKGWPVTGLIGLGLVAMIAIVGAQAPDQTEAIRQVLHATARTSLVLFMLAFSAAGLARLIDSDWTAWLRRNRRQIGVGFALSHLFHGAAIIALARRDPVLFDTLTTPATFIFGGLG